MKIAMWSGPRNLSTAMMYSFGNRADTNCSDEPFYGAYLHHSGVVHPLNQEIIDSQPKNPKDVISAILEPNNPENPNHYYKLLTHHMMSDFPIDWIGALTNVFLIRHPARVIASYVRKRENPTMADLGFEEQKRIYDLCIAQDYGTEVVDSDEILADPKGMLTGLCNNIGLEFDSAMLSWTAGQRSFDGVWASHWYDAVHKSTGFGNPRSELPKLEGAMAELCDQALEIYEDMKAGC